jgi:cell division topological specificity factor
VLDFFKSLFRPEPPSSTTAKERLRLVLLSDHLSLAPEVVESLKRDLLEVISRYVEIDPAHADVTFETREREVAMLANIPITGVRDRPLPPPGRPEAPVADAVAFADPTASEPVLPLTLAVDDDDQDADATATASVTEAAAADAVPRAPRRRRRRKKASGNAGAPSANKLATGSA